MTYYWQDALLNSLVVKDTISLFCLLLFPSFIVGECGVQHEYWQWAALFFYLTFINME